jgi:FkbM family methyltransferase
MSLFQQAKNSFKNLRFSIATVNNPVLYRLYRSYYKPKPGSLAALLYEFSRSHSPVNFIQVGANDGCFHDPLFKFIRMFKWKGVLLEPQPYVFENYLKRLHRNSPGVIPVNAALCYEDGETDIFKIAFSNARWATGLTSFNKHALESAVASGHVARMAKRYGEKLPANEKEFIASVKIKTISPETLISTYDLKRIDWLQIDAEGFDFEIIKMMKIEKTEPRVVVYENSHLSETDQNSCVELLHGNNYSVTNIQENTVAMKNPVRGFEKFFDKVAS